MTFRPVKRGHAADAIFEELAQRILRGDLAPESPLPPERVLAESFDVSRSVVRQAVHRLADMGLVRVRQGGATLVADARESADLRVMELRYRLGPASDRELADMQERRFVEGFALVLFASRRATTEELEALAAQVEAFARDAEPTRDAVDAFERDFWTSLARAGRNAIYAAQIAWWNRLVKERGSAPMRGTIPGAARVAFYRELVRRLVAGEDAPRFYLDTLTDLTVRPA